MRRLPLLQSGRKRDPRAPAHPQNCFKAFTHFRGPFRSFDRSRWRGYAKIRLTVNDEIAHFDVSRILKIWKHRASAYGCRFRPALKAHGEPEGKDLRS
jgi:hypothetical protein